MLEQYVSSFLASYLGKYIRGISDKQLRVSVWDGKLKLSNLELRPESLASASLPVAIHRGYIGDLSVTIPWTRLQSEPVVITIDRLYVVVRPKAAEGDELGTALEAEQKKKDLAAYETARIAGDPAPSDSTAAEKETQAKRQKTFAQRLQEGVANNVQISVENVHIRYEDSDTDPHNPVALGFVMSSARCFRANSEWAEQYISETLGMIHRVLTLEDWSAYLHPCEREEMLVHKFPSSTVYEKQAGEEVKARDAIWCEMDLAANDTLRRQVESHLIVHPTRLSVRLRQQSGSTVDVSFPRTSCDVAFHAIKCSASHAQYQRVIHVFDYLLHFEGLGRLRGLRPLISVLEPTGARQWWVFATSAVARLIREKRVKTKINWTLVHNFRRYRPTYIQLFKRSQGCAWLPPLDKREETDLEEAHLQLTSQQIIVLRDMAYAELEEERTQREGQKLLIEGVAKKQGGGWFGWGANDAKATPPLGEDTLDGEAWTDGDREKLAALGVLDDNAASAAPSSPKVAQDYVEYSVLLDVSAAELSLLSPTMEVFSRFSLADMRVKCDSKAQEGCFKSVISVADLSVADGTRKVLRKRKVSTSHNANLLLCIVERSPHSELRNISADVVLAPIDCVLHPIFASRVSSFFRPPGEINLNLNLNLRNLAEHQVEAMMKGAASVDVKFSMETGQLIIPVAPPASCRGVRVFPSTTSHESQTFLSFERGALILSLGTVSLDTDKERNAIRAEKLLTVANGASPDVTLDDLYQKYHVTFNNISARFALDLNRFLEEENWLGSTSSNIDPSNIVQLMPAFDLNICLERLLTAFGGDEERGSGVTEEVPPSPEVHATVGISSATSSFNEGGLLKSPAVTALPLKKSSSFNTLNVEKARHLLSGSGERNAPPLLKVHCEVPRAELNLSRGSLLSTLYALDTLTVFLQKLTIPDLPETLFVSGKGVKGLESVFCQSLLLCSVHRGEGEVPAVVVLRDGVLFIFEEEGGGGGGNTSNTSFASVGETPYHIAATYNLVEAPFSVESGASEITLQFPQLYTKAKTLKIIAIDASICKGLFMALNKQACDTFRRATNEASRTIAKPERVTLQTSFALERFNLNLFKEVEEVPFATMEFDGFASHISMRKFDQTLRVNLSRMKIVSEAEQILVSSESLVDPTTDAAGHNTNFFAVTVVSCTEQSPLWSSAGPDTDISLKASSLNIAIASGLPEIGNFFFDLLGVNKMSRSHLLKAVYAAPLSYQTTARGDSTKNKDRAEIKLSASMAELRLSCFEEIGPESQSEFLQIAMQKTSFNVVTSENGLRLQGVMGNAIAEEIDEKTGTKRTLLGVSDATAGSLIEVMYVGYNTGDSGGAPTVNGKVTALMRQITSRFHFYTFNRLLHWGTQGRAVLRLKETSNRRMVCVGAKHITSPPLAPLAAPSPAPSVLLLDLRMVNPLVSLPAGVDDADEDCLIAALGDVEIKSELVALGDEEKEYLSRMRINLRDVSINLHPSKANGVIGTKLQLGLTMLNYITQPVQYQNAVLNTLKVELGNFSFSVDEASWALLMQIAARNVMSQYAPRFVPEEHRNTQTGTQFVGRHKSILAVSAEFVNLRILAAGADDASSYSIALQNVSLIQRELTGGKGTEMDCSVEAFILEENQSGLARLPLLDFKAINQKVLNVRIVNQPSNGIASSNVLMEVGAPTVFADPGALFAVQDSLASDKAAEAFNLILSGGVKAPHMVQAAPMEKRSAMHVSLAMQDMTIIGLEKKSRQRPERSEYFTINLHTFEVRVLMVSGLGGACIAESHLSDSQPSYLRLSQNVLLCKAKIHTINMTSTLGVEPIEVLSLPTTFGTHGKKCLIDTLIVKGVHQVAECEVPNTEAPGYAVVTSVKHFMTTELPSFDATKEFACAAPCLGFTQKVSCRIEEVRVLAIPGFWVWVSNWASNGALHQLSMLGTLRAERIKAKMQTPSAVQLAVVWKAPTITLPSLFDETFSNATASTTNCFLQLGQITISNVLKAGDKQIEAMSVTLTRLKFFHKGAAIGLVGDKSIENIDLVKDFTVMVNLLREVGGDEAEIQSDVGEIGLALSDRQIVLLTQVLEVQRSSTLGLRNAPKGQATLSPQRNREEPPASRLTSVVHIDGASVTLFTSAGEPVVSAAMKNLTCSHDAKKVGFEVGSLGVHDGVTHKAFVSTPVGDSVGDVLTTSLPENATCFSVVLENTVDTEHIGVRLRRLHCILEPQFLVKLATFSSSINTMKAASAVPARMQNDVPSVPSTPVDADTPIKTRVIRAYMHEFTLGVSHRPEVLEKLTLQQQTTDEALLILFELDGSVVNVTTDLALNNHNITGSMQSLQVKDTSSGCYAVKPSWSGAHGGEAKSLIDFQARVSNSISNAANGSGSDAAPPALVTHMREVSATMHSLTFTFLPNLHNECLVYLSSGVLKQLAAVSADNTEKTDGVQESHVHVLLPLKYSVQVFNPVVVLQGPDDGDGKLGILCDLGEIVIKNQVEEVAEPAAFGASADYFETISVTLNKMSFAVGRGNVSSGVVDGAVISIEAKNRIFAPKSQPRESADGFTSPKVLATSFASKTPDSQTTIELSNTKAIFKRESVRIMMAVLNETADNVVRPQQTQPAAPQVSLQEKTHVVLNFSIPSLSAVVCNGRSEEIVDFSLGGLELVRCARGVSGAWEEHSFRLATIEMREMWRRGSNTYCRNLCYDMGDASGPTPASVHHTPPDAIRIDSLKETRTHVCSQNVAATLHVNPFIFVPSIVFECYNTFYLPYTEVFTGNTKGADHCRARNIVISETAELRQDLHLGFAENRRFCDGFGSSSGDPVYYAERATHLQVKGEKGVNVIEIRGDKNSRTVFIHLERSVEDTMKRGLLDLVHTNLPFIHVDPGITMRFVDVNIVFCLEGPDQVSYTSYHATDTSAAELRVVLDEVCECAERSYYLVAGNTSLRTQMYKRRVHNIAPPTETTAEPLKQEFNVKFDVSFGVGLAGELPKERSELGAPPIHQRCIMLTGRVVGGEFSATTAVNTPPQSTCAFSVQRLCAVHLPVLPIHASSTLAGAAKIAPLFSQKDRAKSYILRPTDIQASWEKGVEEDSLQVIVGELQGYLCLGDAECVTQFSKALPQAGGVPDQANFTRKKAVAVSQKRASVTVTLSKAAFCLVDDTTGSTLPFLEVVFAQNALKVISKSSADTSLTAACGVSLRVYDEGNCEWTQLVEQTSVSLSTTTSHLGTSKQGARGVGGGSSCADTHTEATLSASFVDVQITPSFVKSLRNFSKKSSGIASGEPLCMQSMFYIHNDCGRNIVVAAFANTEGVQTALTHTMATQEEIITNKLNLIKVASGSGVHFDSSEAFGYICIMEDGAMESRVFELDADLQWQKLSVGIVGVHPVGKSFIAETQNKSGRKHITFRSTVTVQNHLLDDICIVGVGVVPGKRSAKSYSASILSVPHTVLQQQPVVLQPANLPDGQAFGDAQLGYMWGSLLSLRSEWSRYLVAFQSENAGQGDSAYVCSVSMERERGVETTAVSPVFKKYDRKATTQRVVMHINPLVRITNQLPMDLHYYAVGGKKESVGVVKGYGGEDDVKMHELDKAVVGAWPETKIRMAAACEIGGMDLKTEGASLIWNSAPMADIDALLERTNTLKMASGLTNQKFVAHVRYNSRGNPTIFAPIWVVNCTQHAIEVFPKHHVTPTRLPPKDETPLPISLEKLSDTDTLYVTIDKQFEDDRRPPQAIALDVGDVASGGTGSLVFAEGNTGERLTHIGVTCSTVTWPGTDACTRILKFVPKWTIHNTSSQRLSVRLVLPGGTRPSLSLAPGETKLCSSSGAESQIEVKYESDALLNNRFSRPFSIASAGNDLLLRMNCEAKTDTAMHVGNCFAGHTTPNSDVPEFFRVIRVLTTLANGSINVTFTESRKPPFLIENRTGYPISFTQKGISHAPLRVVKPYSTIPYAADDPFIEAQAHFKVLTANGAVVAERDIKIGKPSSHPARVTPATLRGMPAVHSNTQHSADASVSVLCFSEDHYLGKKMRASHGLGYGVYKAAFEGISVGISQPDSYEDITVLTVVNSMVLFKKNPGEDAFNAVIGDVQIDDVTEPHPVYPVVLQREVDAEEGSQTKPFLYVESLMSATTGDVVAIRNLYIRCLPLQLRISDKFLSAVLQFFDTIKEDQDTAKSIVSKRTHVEKAVPADVFSDTLCFISNIQIQGLKVTISFMRQSEDNGVSFTQYSSQRWWLAYILRSVENTSLEWAPFVICDVSLPLSAVLSRVSESYLSALRYQVFVKIPWSTAFLGNPASTVRGIRQGISDLVAKPIQGVRDADSVGTLVTGSIKGVAEGVASLVTNTTGGIAGSVGSLTRSLARTTSRWSFDPDWSSDRQQSSGVAQGVFDGVGGFFHSPVSGYSQDGLAGATAGLAIGTVGLITKPFTGVLDGVSDGLDWVAGKNQSISERVRPPRVYLRREFAHEVQGVSPMELQMLSEQLRAGEITPVQMKKKVASFETLAAEMTWEQFHAVCTEKEFYQYAYLARDVYLAGLHPLNNRASTPAIDPTRVQHLYRTLGAAALSSDPSLQVGPEELAYVTTWEEFQALFSFADFYKYARAARDACVKKTYGFKLLKQPERRV